jgi:acyl-CoA dehydrogenase
MIDFSLSPEMELLTATVRRFVETELWPLEVEVEETGRLDPAIARALTAKSRALGLYAMNMPRELGGGGLTAVEMCLCEEEIGRTSDILIRRAFGNVYEVLLACTGSQRERYLLPAVRGERVCSIAMSEPEAGSDAAGIQTTAVRDARGFILNGTKHFISDGDYADFFVVTAVTDRSGSSPGITLFLVDKAMRGFEMGRIQPMMGLRGTGHVEFALRDCRVGHDQILGELDGGLPLILRTISRIRLAHIGARAVGMASRLLELCRDHANTRRQFGRPIGEFQMVQQMLADMATEVHAARLLALNAAWDLDQGRESREKVSMVKLYGSEMLGRVADRAVQIFGGLGYCKDLIVERVYRDCRVLRIFDGTSEIHRRAIARGLLKNGPLR